MEVVIACVAVFGFAAIVLSIYVITHSITERDARLLGKMAELLHSHMPVGEPISVVQKKLDLQAARDAEVARGNEFKRARIMQHAEQLASNDPEQD